MGGAYSTGSTGIGGNGVGGNGSQPLGGRFPDSRGGNTASGGQSLLDQNSFPWLNITRGGQLPPSAGSSNIGAPSLRGPQPSQLPQQPHQPQQQPQSGSQSGIEEIIANLSRSNPNFLYTLDQLLETYRNQQQQQQQPQSQHYQSQLLAAQISQAAAVATNASRSRSPILHQQSPQTGVSRPSSGSLVGLAGQSTSDVFFAGRPGSATSIPFTQVRGSNAGGANNGLKYGSGVSQQQQLGLSEQLVSAAVAAGTYPHRPSSSASASLRPASSTYNVLPSSTTAAAQFHQAYAALGALGPAGSHSENLQDLARGGQSLGGGSGSGMPPTKRMRLVSSSGSSVPPTAATPSSSPYLQQSSTSLSRQQQQQQQQQQQAEMLNRQLLQTTANNRTAILAFFSNAAQQQQQQQQQQAQQQAAAAASTGRTSVSSAYFQGGSEPYGQRSGVQRQPGSQLLVSSPNTMAQPSTSASASAAAATVAAYNNFAALAVATAAAQQQQQQQQQQQRAGYLHPTGGSSASTIPSRSYRGQPPPQQQQPPPSQSQQTSSGVGGYHSGHSIPGGSGVVRQQTKEPAYHPQVEAISPAPEEARLLDAVEVKLQREREEMQRRLHEIELRINKEESHLRYLIDRESSLTADLKNETAAQPPSSTPHKNKVPMSELEDERAYENPIQALLWETRSRAKRQHESLACLCGKFVSASPCALPVYRQPWDLPTLQHLQSVYKNGFRRQLIKYIHRRKRAEKARLRILARQYARHAQAFFKRHEKLMNSAKRKQKDTKNREIFEKTFPELKKNREDQNQKDGGKGDDAHDTGSNTGSNGADADQIYDAAEDVAKMKEYAIDPPVTLPPWERSYRFICTAHLVTDPKSEHIRAQSLEKWSKEDKARFKERFLATPKNFTAIAAAMDKSVADCIHYYYLSKKTEGYKALVKKHSSSRRRRAGHSDKNGPTGPSHGTKSKTAPSKVSTPGGDVHRNSPHPDSKNDDSHPTTHRKGGGGGSTRGRSGRRGGGGDHRTTKGSARGRSGTPVPQNSSTAASSSASQPENASASVAASATTEISKQSSSGDDSKCQGSVKTEDAKANQPSSGKTATDSPSVKSSNGSSIQPIKVKEEGKEVAQSAGSKAVEGSSTSEDHTPLVFYHELAKQNADKLHLQGGNSNTQAPSSLDPRRGYTASTHHYTTAVTDTINLTQSSSVSGTYSPNAHPDEPAVSRPGFSESGVTSGVLPPKDSTAATVLAAGLPEQLASLSKTGSISPELLANIPQLSSNAASSQALAQVLTQTSATGASQKGGGHDQLSDPAAAAYSKAILIGDFCTAQQLSRGSTPSQQTSMPTTANMIGTSIQRAVSLTSLKDYNCRITADYTDPTYLSGRTIDPSSLPMPAKRMVLGGSAPSAVSRGFGGHMRSPPGSGTAGYHHQPPPPLPPSRHRPILGQPSINVDGGVPRQTPGRPLLGISQNSMYGLQTGYGSEAITASKPAGYCDLRGVNPLPKKRSSELENMNVVANRISFFFFRFFNSKKASTNLETSSSMSVGSTASGRSGLDPKIEEYIAHAAKLYQDEVERYTSRDRSDSMRTRTSSETSQQMHAALDNARQRVLRMAAAVAAASDSANVSTGYSIPPSLADLPMSNDQMGGVLDINEMLAKCGPQYLSLIAATAAEASGSAASSTSEGLGLFASREISRPSPLEGNPSTQFSPASQAIPLPRYRKSASSSSNPSGPSASFSSPTLSSAVSASSSSVGPIPQREFFQGLTDDSGYHLHHHLHHSQQQPLRYPTLMRASASRNLESVGLLPQELARKTSISRPQLSTTSAPVSSSLVISSSTAGAPTSSAPTTFRPESTTQSACMASNPISSTGTLQETIEKAIADGIIVQRGGQEPPKIDPSIAEAKSVKSTNPSTSLVKADSDTKEMSRSITSTSRSSSAGVLLSPTQMFPKKRSRLGSSGSSVALAGGQIRSVSPSRSTRGESGGAEAPTPSGSAPSASPISSTPEDRAIGALTSKSPVMVPTFGITPISPPSSGDSPGNLQIFIPPEDEQSPHNDGRHSASLSRQTSNSKSSLSGGGTAGITSPSLANETAGSPRHNPASMAPAASPQQEQQKTPQSP
ncbi:hypothetical protein Aperf_G00000001935 [Anoplocephala perfoliata]